MKTILRIEFPCGFKYFALYKSGIFEFFSADIDAKLPEECPIHGNKCKR